MGHDLFGHLFAGASEGDGGFFGWLCREDGDEVLGGRLVADGDEKEREAPEEEHDAVHEAFDEVTEHLIVVRLGGAG